MLSAVGFERAVLDVAALMVSAAETSCLPTFAPIRVEELKQESYNADISTMVWL